MLENQCPDCAASVTWLAGKYHCEKCQHVFERVADCDQCGQRLERLQACGSESYFCNTCNELKSKSRVKRYLISAE